jgi:hypothetical protein
MKDTLVTFTIVIMTAASSISGVQAANFGDDVAFLKKHTSIIVLSDRQGRAKIAIAPAYQGRVMTSTAGGDAGLAFGWINRELIASGTLLPHINVFGGEDRFWLGPEGGQYSIFFAKGAKFELSDWFAPPAIDTMPYAVANQSEGKAAFSAEYSVTNYSGTRFYLKVDREVRLLPTAAAWKRLGVPAVNRVSLVAFESDNKITNVGKHDWKKETGLLSIWILGMFNPSPATTIVVPIQPGLESKLGVKVTTDYFGIIPPDRFVVKENVLYFSGDGKYRSKIGINPRRSKAVLGSYDADDHVLTVVQFTQSKGATDYVNSLWKLQDNPYDGDAANSYNDGPPAPGVKPLGPFYELESSSPAAALRAGKSLTHVHRTIHLIGPEAALEPVARAAFGVSLEEIKMAIHASSAARWTSAPSNSMGSAR